MSEQPSDPGMTPRQARAIEWGIIALCLLSLIFIFQPFTMPLFSIGAGLVVLGGLMFNLVPLCRPGVPLRSIITAAAIVFGILIVAIGLAIGSAELYAIYLRSA